MAWLTRDLPLFAASCKGFSIVCVLVSTDGDKAESERVSMYMYARIHAHSLLNLKNISP